MKKKKKIKDFQFESSLSELGEDELRKYVGSLFNHVTSLSEQKREDEELREYLDKYRDLCEVRYNGELKECKRKLMLARGVMKLKGINGVKEIDEIIQMTKDPYLIS